MVTSGCPPSESNGRNEARIRRLVEFWNQLRIIDQLGATLLEALEPLERQVTDCLYQEPPDIGRAESLTALALRVLAGHSRG